MATKLLLILSAACLCRSECVQVDMPKFGRIEISAFSFIGDRIEDLSVDLIDARTRKSLKSQFAGAVAPAVPYGRYLLRVSAPGFRSSEREIQLAQPELAVRVQLSVSVECGGSAEIGGTVRHAPADREIWVKLVPLQGAGGTEARVNRSGYFLAGGLDAGQYLLLVVDGQKIIQTANVTVPNGSPVEIDLAKN